MRQILLAVLLGAVSSIAVGLNVRFTLGANPDGAYSTQYTCVASDRSDCAPPTIATLMCDDSAAPSLVNLTTGSAYSANVRQYFSGSAAATATLSVVTVSGDNATTEGWAISSAGAGNNLTHPGDQTGAGVLRIRGTTGGNSVDCGVRNWSFIAPGGTDTTAPTIPTGCTATGGTGTVTVSCDASSDPYVSQAGSGVDEYDIRLGAVVVGTLTGQSHGLSQALTQTIIGSSDGTPSSTQSGADWDLSFGGTGVVGTADNILYRAAQIAGTAFSTVKVNSITSAATAPTAGLMARESTSADSAMATCRYSVGSGVRLSYRATTGAVRASGTPVSASLPLWLKLDRTGDVWTCSYSTDGGTWIVADTHTVALTATLYRGIFISSSTASTNATADLDQLSINNVAPLSYQHTTNVGGSYSVRARDVSDNNSAYSTAVTGTPTGAGDIAGPTIVTQPSGASGGQTSINWNLGGWSDPSGVASYTPSIANGSSCTGSVDQPSQATNLYSQSGLTAGGTYSLRSKAVDTLGNLSSYSNCITVTTQAAASLLFSDLWSTVYSPYPSGIPTYPTPWGSSSDPGCTRTVDTSLYRDAPGSFKAVFGAGATNNSHCMIVYNGPPDNFVPGVEYWLGFSMYLSGSWPADTANGAFSILWQMHGDNTGTANNPMAKIDAANGEGGPWKIQVLGDTTNNKPYERSVTYTSCGNVVTGRWVDVVANFKFGNPGFWKIWFNGAQCIDDSGLNYFLTYTFPPYTTIGLYHGWGNGTASPQRAIYFDQWRVGRASDGVGYAEVAPR
jgi:hypothetical protein